MPDGDDMDFNSHAETYTADPFVSEFGQKAYDNLNTNFPSIVPLGPGTTAMDFGTGGGNVAFRLSAQGVEKVVALDPAENMIKVVDRRILADSVKGVTSFVGTCEDYVLAVSIDVSNSGAEVHTAGPQSPTVRSEGCVHKDSDGGDVNQPTPLPHSFDLITASSVLAFVDDKTATLQCLKTLLRGKDSHIVHWDWVASSSDESAGGFTLQGVRKLHTECGLETVSCDVCFNFMGMDVLLGIAKSA